MDYELLLRISNQEGDHLIRGAGYGQFVIVYNDFYEDENLREIWCLLLLFISRERHVGEIRRSLISARDDRR